MGLPNEALVNYIFPNDHVVWWSLLIVIYPYITGLVAGAFVVSALYKVFKVEEFKPIANFALISALCFGLFAAVPLLFHLGQPQRAFEIYWTPHTTSAMSIFGYVYGSYMLVLITEIWLIYRPFFIKMANESSGFMQRIWQILTLGVSKYNPASAAIDHKVIIFLAGIGIPWAFLLHGYVGFIFGSVKARDWWASPLQPLIFLMSAVVSGMAILILMYSFIKWHRKEAYDYVMIKKFSTFLWGIFILDFVLEMLEVLFTRYEQGHHWSLIEPLLEGPLFNTYVIGQVLVLSVIPLIVLGFVALFNMRDKLMLYLANFGGLLLITQVMFMRYNTVIGGQMLSKSERGFVEFDWELFSSEGVLVCLIILIMPFVVYNILSRFLPILEDIPLPESSDSKE